MSEVPDIGSSAIAQLDVGGAAASQGSQGGTLSAGSSPAVVPAASDDNLTMDAEDSLPAIHLQSGAGSGVGDEPGQVLTTVQPPSPSQMETNDELSFGTQIMMLEQKELQTENVEELSAQFYSQLLAYYLIEQNWVKARLCRMRANACSNDAQLSVIIAISKHLENGETGAALKLIKSYNFVGLFKVLMTELQSRVYLCVFHRVQKCYVTIECEQFAKMLDANDERELQQLMTEYGWTIDQDRFIRPTETKQLQTLISEKLPALSADNAAQRGNSPIVSTERATERSLADQLYRLTKVTSFMEVNA